jgi:hypothetical protein
VKSLQAKIGELTLENDFLEGSVFVCAEQNVDLGWWFRRLALFAGQTQSIQNVRRRALSDIL